MSSFASPWPSDQQVLYGIDFALGKSTSVAWSVLMSQPGALAMVLNKSEAPPAVPLVDEDGELNTAGQYAVGQYARDWVGGMRLLTLERQYPELRPWFYDIRNDPEAAERFA